MDEEERGGDGILMRAQHVIALSGPPGGIYCVLAR